MSLREWFGFTKPRDAPDTELPKIEDNVRDSGGVFVFGMTNSGELVNEKSALQISTVYACVRLLAETVASLPLHLYKFTDTGAGKERATEHPLYKILYRQANPEMTSFSFREAMMMHLLLWGNAYAFPASITRISSSSVTRSSIFPALDSMALWVFRLSP